MSSAKTLQISYIGMQTQEVAIKPRVQVTLKSDSEMLDEVVVVAYLDRHVLETGLEEVGTELTLIEKHPSNMFLLSIVELMVENNALTFNLMTMDGCTFLVTHSEQNEVYIKRV